MATINLLIQSSKNPATIYIRLRDGKKIDLKFVEKFEDIVFDDSTKFFLDISKGTNRVYKRSQVSAESGQSVLEAMDMAMDMTMDMAMAMAMPWISWPWMWIWPWIWLCKR